MQTFLPYPSFRKSAACLDRARLGKQRVECKQMLLALGVPVGDTQPGLRKGWVNHPAVRMWRGHEIHLAFYAVAICREWRNRGYKDGLLPEFLQAIDRLPASKSPNWIGWGSFHAAHRSNLLRKDAVHYGRFGWAEPHDLPYVWPGEAA